MTKYETIAVFLSTIAILIPIIQWLWRKYIIKPRLEYFPNGNAYLFANNSGSYIRIDGVFEAQKKPIVVKDVALKVIRKNDEKILNLAWSSFISPVNQNVMGVFSSTTEAAHPFKIEQDSIGCAFIEFANQYNSAFRKITPLLEDVQRDVHDIACINNSFDYARELLCGQKSYIEYQSALNSEMFWEIGQYEVEMKVSYGKSTKAFKLCFEVNREQYEDLKYNIEEVLISKLKNCYNMGYNLRSVQVSIKEQ